MFLGGGLWVYERILNATVPYGEFCPETECAVPQDQNTPLHHAAMNGKVEVVTVLMAKADIDARNKVVECRYV